MYIHIGIYIYIFVCIYIYIYNYLRLSIRSIPGIGSTPGSSGILGLDLGNISIPLEPQGLGLGPRGPPRS